jgi:hypothetical protein
MDAQLPRYPKERDLGREINARSTNMVSKDLMHTLPLPHLICFNSPSLPLFYSFILPLPLPFFFFQKSPSPSLSLSLSLT